MKDQQDSTKVEIHHETNFWDFANDSPVVIVVCAYLLFEAIVAIVKALAK